MILRKWNESKGMYEPYEVPNDWTVCTYSDDMDKVINCARCGRKMIFGDGFSSSQIHTGFGMGYVVCEECYEKERLEFHRS